MYLYALIDVQYLEYTCTVYVSEAVLLCACYLQCFAVRVVH